MEQCEYFGRISCTRLISTDDQLLVLPSGPSSICQHLEFYYVQHDLLLMALEGVDRTVPFIACVYFVYGIYTPTYSLIYRINTMQLILKLLLLFCNTWLCPHQLIKAVLLTLPSQFIKALYLVPHPQLPRAINHRGYTSTFFVTTLLHFF